MDRATHLEKLRALRAAELEHSRALQAAHVPPGRGLDLARLDAVTAGLSAKTLGSVLSGRSNKTEIVSLGSGDADAEPIAAELVNLADEAALSREVRGQDDLAVGFPFLVGQIAGASACGPLFLVPRALVLDESGRRKPRWILPPADDARTVLANRTLARALGLDPDAMAEWGRSNLMGLRRTPTWLTDACKEVAAWLAESGVFVEVAESTGRAARTGDDERVPALPSTPEQLLGPPTLAPHALLSRMPMAEEVALEELEAMVHRMQADRGCALGAADWLLAGAAQPARPAGASDPGRTESAARWWSLRQPESGLELAMAAIAASRSIVVEAASGTDPIGYAADLVAGCVGDGRRTLLVAPSQATLQAVAERLGPEAQRLVVVISDAHAAAAAMDAATEAARDAPAAPTVDRESHIAGIRRAQEWLQSVRSALDAPLAGGGTARAAIERLLSLPAVAAELPTDVLTPLTPEALAADLPAFAQVVRDRLLNNAPGTWAEHRPSYAEFTDVDLHQFVERALPEAVRAVDSLLDWMSHDPGHGQTLGEAADRAEQCRRMLGLCEKMLTTTPDGWRWVQRLVSMAARGRTEGSPVALVQRDRTRLEQFLELRELGQGKELVASEAEQKAAEAAFQEWSRLAGVWYRPFMAGWYTAQADVEEALEREGISAPALVDGIAEWRRRRDYSVMLEGLPAQLSTFELSVHDLRTASFRDLDLDLAAALEAAERLEPWNTLSAEDRTLLPRGIPTSSRALSDAIAVLQHASKARELADRFEEAGKRLEAWVGPAVGTWVEDAFAAGDASEVETRFRTGIATRFRAMSAADQRRAELAARSPELAALAAQLAPHFDDASPQEIADSIASAYAWRWFRGAVVEQPLLGEVDDSALQAARAAVADGWQSLAQQNRLAVASTLRMRLIEREKGISGGYPGIVADVLDAGAPRVLTPPPPVCFCTPQGAAALAPAAVGFDVALVIDAGRLRLADALPSLARARCAVVVGDSDSVVPLGLLGTSRPPPGRSLAAANPTEPRTIEAALATGHGLRLAWSREPGCPELRTLAGFLRPDGGPAVSPTPCPGESAVSWLAVGGRWLSTGNDHEAVLAVEVVARLFASKAADDVAVITLEPVQAARVNAEVARRRTLDTEFAQALSVEGGRRFRVRPVEAFAGERPEVVVLTIGGVPDPSGRLAAGLGALGNRMARRLSTVLGAPRRHLLVLCSFDPGTVDAGGDPGLDAFLAVLRELRRLAGGGRFDQQGQPESTPLLAEKLAGALADRGIACEPAVGIGGVMVDLALGGAGKSDCTPVAVLVDPPVAGDEAHLRSSLLHAAGWCVETVDALTWLRDSRAVIARLSDAREAADAALAAGGRDLGITLPTGSVARPSPPRKGRVQPGSVVRFRRLDTGTEEKVTLSAGATPGSVGLDAPLAQTLLGALPKDRVVLRDGPAAVTIEVVEVDGAKE